ncbi:hypothetical protein B0H13DRAFT_2548593 [Mycena leptocephala]|nr:hypothetical protein B0H13DRAFT_2548593 [Mycena leptocephala]
MSVTELQAHIAQLSADIEQLENRKSAAQRQLNAIRDPVSQLPLEISSEIFRQCLPPFPIRPTLGTQFRFDVRSFTSLGPFSVLQTLTIEANRDRLEDDDLEVFRLDDIIELLRSAPNLIECTFDNVLLGEADEPEEKLVLLNLRCLKFGKSENIRNFQSEDVILDHLSLPALETLTLSFTTISSGGFSLFLKRSLPPLQELVGRTRFGFTELDEWLRLVPSLTRLELYLTNETCTDGLFSALADSSHFLPNLRTLKLLQHFSQSSYETVFRALSTRRAQLTCVDLRARFFISKPSADVCDGLRQLAADGMEIYVGTHRTNFLSLPPHPPTATSFCPT